MRQRSIRKLTTLCLAFILCGEWNAWAQRPAPPVQHPVAALDELVSQALAHNPELLMLRREYDARRARVPQATAMPQPTVSVGWMGNIAPFTTQVGDPSSNRAIGFDQELPFPGKLATKGKVATKEAESAWWALSSAELRIAAEVKASYFDLWFIERSIEVQRKNKDLTEKFVKIAEARYAVGKGSQQDILKAQVEVSKYLETLTTLDLQREAAVIRLNNLLYRSPDAPLTAAGEVTQSEMLLPLAELNDLAVKNSPDLKAQQSTIDARQYEVSLSKKEFYPDLGVGFTYQNRERLPEMYGVTVKISVPLYFWQRQQPAVAEASAGLAASRHAYDNARSILLYRVKDQYLILTTSNKLLDLYSKSIIPQSTATFESSISSYETGSVDFLTLLDNLITLRNYELSYYQQLRDYQKALAALEPLVGVKLVK